MRQYSFEVPEPTLDERFSELRRSVDGEIARARREAIAELACAVARMRSASNESEWSAAVLESGRPFAEDSSALSLLAAVAALTAPSVARTPAGAPPSANPRALRFAKVKIAEMRLYQAIAVEKGRAAGDLYGSLKPHIDAAREAFREKFLTGGNGTVDYLHYELVRALANDDTTLLGPGYPGPLA